MTEIPASLYPLDIRPSLSVSLPAELRHTFSLSSYHLNHTNRLLDVAELSCTSFRGRYRRAQPYQAPVIIHPQIDHSEQQTRTTIQQSTSASKPTQSDTLLN